MLFFIQITSNKYVIKVIFQHYTFRQKQDVPITLCFSNQKINLSCILYFVGLKMACFVHLHQVRVIKRQQLLLLPRVLKCSFAFILHLFCHKAFIVLFYMQLKSRYFKCNLKVGNQEPQLVKNNAKKENSIFQRMTLYFSFITQNHVLSFSCSEFM